MKYAIVKDGVVTNVIVADYYNANKIAKSQGGIAVLVDNIPTEIGDTYTEDFKFMRDAVEILRILPPEEKLPIVEDTIDSLILDNLIMTEVVDTLVLAQLEG